MSPEDNERAGRDGAAALQWLSASADVYRGLNHSLSNRLLSLEMLSTVAQRGEDVDDDLLAIVAGESGRFQTLLRLYRLMESGERSPSEPALVTDILPDAVSLFGHHSGLRDVSVHIAPIGDLSPVLLHPSSLAQALLVAIVAVARVAASADVGVIVRCSGDADWVEVRAISNAPVPTVVADEGRELVAVPLLLKKTPSESAWERSPEGVVSAILRLASLGNVRRRERAG